MSESAKPLTCRIVRGVDEASKVEARWTALTRDLAEPNLFYEPWFLLPVVPLAAHAESFELLLVEREGERDGELCGVFPLLRSRLHARLPLEHLSVYTNEFLPLAVPLVRRDQTHEVARAVFAHLATEKRVASLGFERAATAGPVFLAMIEAAREAGTQVEARKLYDRAFFDPREPFEEYCKLHVSRKKRDQANRTSKKLASEGALTFDEMPQEEGALGTTVDAFLDLEASGWKGREGTALRSNPRTEVFFRQVTRAAFDQKRLHVVTMRLDGRPIAMKVNLLDAPTSYTYKVAYDESYAKLSPGVILELESMRRVAVLPGIRTMDSAGRGENPPFDWLWNARRPIGMVELSTGRGFSDLFVLGRPAAKWLKDRTTRALASAKRRVATRA